ncbi:MAG: TniQ family protein [Phascolarctobacterium sp.]|nr:TniQ family protein [Phascolarctobacterium sp.]
MLPVFLVPYEDELLYSWINRLADANNVPYRVFISKYFESRGLAAGGKRSFFLFADGVPLVDPGAYFLNVTTYPFEAFFMSRGMQTKSVLPAFRFKNGLNSIDITDFKHIKVCSECVYEDLEDFGEWYIRRSHQLSGVCVCHKHGVELKSLNKPPIFFDCIPSDMLSLDKVASMGLELEYAVFAKKMLDMKVVTDFETVSEKFFSFIGSKDEFVRRFLVSRYAPLYKSNILLYTFLDNARKSKSVLPDNILPLIMYCYDGNAEAFCNDVAIDSVPADFEGYKLLGDYGLLKLYKHLGCGKRFVMSEHGMSMGFGCPFCERFEPEDIIFKRLIYNISGAEYEVMTPFTGMWDKVVLKHIKCGHEFSVRPGNFLFKGTRCKCGQKHTEAELKTYVESHEGFKFVRLGRYKPKIIVRHEACGQEFEISFFEFKKRPFCRACSGPSCHEDYVAKVKALTGDEYTVLSETAKHRATLIRHNTCGRISKYILSNFFNGFRCHYCDKPLRFEALKDIVQKFTSGRYSVEQLSGDGKSRLVDSVTGESKILSNRLILQELRRPTRSDIIVLSSKEEADRLACLGKKHGNNNIDMFFVMLKEKYKPGQIITYDDFPRSERKYKDSLIYLCRCGKLKRISPGQYILSNEL